MKAYLQWVAVYISLGIIYCIPTCFAQQNLHFDHLSLADGLSQSVVFTIFQDSRGFLWIGTQDGLNRYDGYNFKIYTHDPEDSTSLSDNHIGAIVEDHQGNLWVGTDNGLNKFDRNTDQFTRFFHNPQDPQSLSDNVIGSLFVDSQGILWIGGDNHGLNR